MIEQIFDRSSQLERGINISSVYNTKIDIERLLNLEFNFYDRHKAVIYYANLYRQEMALIAENEANQQPDVTINNVFLSSAISTVQLRRFIAAGCILGKKDQYTRARKRIYLEARKQFQVDADDFFDYFADSSPEERGAGLREIVSSSRELVRGRKSDNTSDLYTYHFLGSVMSERAVKLSLQQNITTETRYGTAEEDCYPYKADIVVPLPQGNMPIQVKMRTLEDAKFMVRPLRRVPHVFMPMRAPEIRTQLNSEEDELLALSILEANEYGQWQPLQTGVDEVKLAA